MRDIQPVTVALRVDPLEPYREPGARGVAGAILGHVPAVGNGDVSMHFHFDRIEIACEVLFVLDSLEKTLAVVDQQRLAAGGPAVTVRKAEVARADAIH